MSLINKMLQDLDMRTDDTEPVAGTTIIEDLQPANDSPATRPAGKRKWVMFAVPVLALLLIALAIVVVKTDVMKRLWPNATQPAATRPAAATSPADKQTGDSQPGQTKQNTATSDDNTHIAAATDKAAKTASEQPADKHHDATSSHRQADTTREKPAAKKADAHGSTATVQSRPVKILRQSTPDLQAQESYQSAIRQYNKGHIAKAEQLLHEALSYLPDLAPARMMLVSLVLEENRWQEAQQLLLEGMTRQPDHYEYSLQLAQILTSRNEEDEAIGVLENGLPYASSDAQYLGFLATLYQRHERHANAADLYSMALERQPLAGKWWLGLGLSLESLNNPDAARNAYIKARLTHSLDQRLDTFARQRIDRLSRPGNEQSDSRQPED